MCIIDGCCGDKKIKGMCQAHYDLMRRNGDPHKRFRTERGAALDWIRSNAKYCGDDCLPWPFKGSPDGYGRAHYNGTRSTASRVMCEVAHGAPPTKKHQAAHSCGNGHLGCVNPRHLRWATCADNQNERVMHGTSNRGERQHKAILTAGMVREIRASNGVSVMDLSRRLGVSYSSISHVIRGNSWSWVV